MGTKHTPGHWLASHDYCRSVAHGTSGWAVGPIGKEVASVHNEGAAEADARLIAAAPDLLSACQSAYLVLGYDAQGDDDAAQASRELRRAIAKAEGGEA